MSILNSSIVPVSAGGYDIPNSLRFNDNDSAYLSRTPSAGNLKTWTYSGWVKRGNLDTRQLVFVAANPTVNTSGQQELQLVFTASNRLQVNGGVSGVSQDILLNTSQLFRDASAWYHIVCVMDTTQATSTDRVKIYVNGEQVTDLSTTTYPTLNYETAVNKATVHGIGGVGTQYLDGYLAEVNFIDGQALTPADFGETGDYGEWKPTKYAGTYGTNGFYLDFKDSGSLGNDANGSNNWTPNNLAATDQMLDSPTNNFATLNPLDTSATTVEGNLGFIGNASWKGARCTFAIPTTGKWYFEAASTVNSQRLVFGIANTSISTGTGWQNTAGFYGFAIDSGAMNFCNNGSSANWGAGTSGRQVIINIAIDADNGKLYLGLNNSYYNAASTTNGNPSAGTNPSISGLTVDNLFPAMQRYDSGTTIVSNFGQDSSFAGNKTAQGNQDGNGIGDFYYTPPTGFLALCTSNLPDATVIPSEHFNAVTYTGNGIQGRTVTSGFATDFVIIKNRNTTDDHVVFDKLRGGTKYLYTNANSAETTYSSQDVTFQSTGITVGSYQSINQSSGPIVSWNWKANGSGVSNTEGSITSTVSANVDAGFSIVSYTGNGTSGATVGHGLSQKPELIVAKARASTSSWVVYNKTIGAAKYMYMNTAAGKGTSSIFWNNTEPTSSLVTLGNNLGVNNNAKANIMYAFHSVDGYSKVGSYTGNGNNDGTFVYTGFRPAYIMLKKTNSTSDWAVFDTSRDTYNATNLKKLLAPNTSAVESNAAYGLDINSNGFKLRVHDTWINSSAATYIYIAFAEQPFKHTNAR